MKEMIKDERGKKETIKDIDIGTPGNTTQKGNKKDERMMKR
jgi:hypothetical protein